MSISAPKSKRIVAIHQPNFFPWLGYFGKIAQSDAFLLMDNVQFSKGSWTNRVKLIVDKKPAWVTMPIVKPHHELRNICDIQIDNSKPWRTKILKTIQMSYSRAPFFDDVFTFLAKLVEYPTDSLAEYNLFTIRSLAEALQLGVSKLVLGSVLNTEGKATDLLISMVKSVGGTAYLCGGGAERYQEDGTFAEAGIELIHQNFEHPVYLQRNTKEFIPGLSTIDALLNCGFEETRSLIVCGIDSNR